MADFSKFEDTNITNFKPYVEDIPNFPLEGITFKDIQPLLEDPKAFNELIKQMFSKFETYMDYWVGIDSRGFIFASAYYMVLSKSYDLEYGTDTIEMKPGKGKVVIVDDVYATGGTMEAAVELCKQSGYEVLGKLVFIDLAFLHEPTDVKSIIKYE